MGLLRTFNIVGLDSCGGRLPETVRWVKLVPARTGSGCCYAYWGNNKIGWISAADRPPSAPCSAHVLQINKNHYVVEIADDVPLISDRVHTAAVEFYKQQPEKDLRPYIAPTKEPIMATTVKSLVSANKQAATSAAYLEAGRVANNQAAKVAAKKLPIMVRGYADTPYGKLVIANLAVAAAQQFRPEHVGLAKVTQAMATQAYHEVFQQLDVDGLIDQLLDSPAVKSALAKLDRVDIAE